MTKATIGTWGKSLAVRVPADVARLAGLTDGESVEIETVDGDIVIRREEAKAAGARQAAEAVAAIKELRKGYRLDGISIRELIDEGRKY